jgi:glycosyltransferase involved in cell wall biosynthesis
MTDVVLPCRDEAAALPGLLARMPAGYRPIVVDNGSTDGSAAVARAHGAEVISVAEPGYGAAVHAGVLAADPAQLPRLAGPVLAGTAELGTGRRRPAARGVWPLHARVANAVLARRLRRTTGLDVHDIGPIRAVRRDDLLALGLRDRRFGYPLELLIEAGRAGWRVVEVDVDYHPRAAGTRSKVTGTVLGTARAVRDMSAVLAR